jgi:hypothetical protein
MSGPTVDASMRTLRLVMWSFATAVAAVGCGPVASDHVPETHAAPPPVIERPFASGGRVTMRLGAGGYSIEGSPDPLVRLAWETRDPADARRVRAEIRTEGTEATIETSGPHNGFTVVIRVPQRSDLWVKLTAGDLKVGNVEGHKHVTALAGDLKIAVGSSAQYRAVDASVVAGDIDAHPFGGRKGGLFRSIRWDGHGAYDLRVRLTAGDISLRE